MRVSNVHASVFTCSNFEGFLLLNRLETKHDKFGQKGATSRPGDVMGPGHERPRTPVVRSCACGSCIQVECSPGV